MMAPLQAHEHELFCASHVSEPGRSWPGFLSRIGPRRCHAGAS
jgi:hypothetical protein